MACPGVLGAGTGHTFCPHEDVIGDNGAIWVASGCRNFHRAVDASQKPGLWVGRVGGSGLVGGGVLV